MVLFLQDCSLHLFGNNLPIYNKNKSKMCWSYSRTSIDDMDFLYFLILRFSCTLS